MKPYELDLDSQLALGVTSIELTQSLDASSRLNVQMAFRGEKRKDQALASFPQTLSLKCQGKSIFKGSLNTVRTVGIHKVELEFHDKLDLLHRTFESEFVKGQRLQDFLQQVASLAGLRAKFMGRFSQELPGMDLGGVSYFDHITALAFEYGFYFVEHSVAGELIFIAVGAHREKVSVDKPKVLSGQTSRSVQDLFASAEVMAFDSQEGRSSKQEIAASSIYEGLGFLKAGGSFDQRSRWAQAQGRMETVTAAGKSPEKHRQALLARLSKRASRSDEITLTTSEWVGFPGDRVDLKTQHDKNSEGSYLIGEVRTKIQSAAPQQQMVLFRA